MMRADDALKYAAALLHARADWVVDSIAGSLCEGADGHEAELDAIADISAEIDRLAADFGNRLVYSDGRVVKSGTWIDNVVYTEHIWHPDATQEESRSWRGRLISDPGVPSPGLYEVTTYPVTQEIHIRVVRTA